MDWTAIQDFVAVAETGSLSGAARRLNVSQPTVGRRIEALEEQLNVMLFNRSAQGLRLTQAGELMLGNANRMQEEALLIERLATGVNQQLEGTVRISCVESLGLHWLPKILPEFFRHFPALKLEVNVDNRNVNLLKREADIALRMARPKQLDLVTRYAGEMRYGLYASSDYLEINGIPIRIRELRQHYYVGYEYETVDDSIIKKFERLFQKERILHRTNSQVGQLEATAAGIGVGVLACFYADHDERLQRILPSDINYKRDIWLVTHAEIARNARIRSVFDFLGKSLDEDQEKLSGIIM